MSKNSIYLNIEEMKKSEQRVLNYMLLSEMNFTRMIHKLSQDDFTFFTHKVIFAYLNIYENIFDFSKMTNANYAMSILEEFASLVYDERALETQDIIIDIIIDILSQPPSEHIKIDLKFLKLNSLQKKNQLEASYTHTTTLKVDDKDGAMIASYTNNKSLQLTSQIYL